MIQSFPFLLVFSFPLLVFVSFFLFNYHLCICLVRHQASSVETINWYTSNQKKKKKTQPENNHQQKLKSEAHYLANSNTTAKLKNGLEKPITQNLLVEDQWTGRCEWGCHWAVAACSSHGSRLCGEVCHWAAMLWYVGERKGRNNGFDVWVKKAAREGGKMDSYVRFP